MTSRQLHLILYTGLIAILLTGCGKSNSGGPMLDQSGKHPAGWVANHSVSANSSLEPCKECHGNDLGGGISSVTCFTASYNGIGCHASIGDCSSCHTAAKGSGRRVIIGAGGDYALAYHHISFNPAVATATCIVCHDQTGHKFVDKTSGVAVRLKNMDTGSAVSYDGTSSNNGEAHCVSCHDADGASSLGANASKPFTGSGDDTAPVNISWTTGVMAHSAKMACFNCHGNSAGSSNTAAATTDSPRYNGHGSATAKMLLDTDYTSADNSYCYKCHAGGSSTRPVADRSSIDVKTPITTATYRHSTATCYKCHNQHMAKTTASRVQGRNSSAGAVRGAPGYSVAWSAAWTSGTIGSSVTATWEYQICIPCHHLSEGSGAAAWTDTSLEFNPKNKSFHPVVAALNSTGSGSSRLISAQLTNGWTRGMTMYCSDCHGRASLTTGAKGPHGSSVKWMLTGRYRAWPYTTTAYNGTDGTPSGTFWNYDNSSDDPGRETNGNGIFCYNCHPSTAPENHIHVKNQFHIDSTSCVTCHIRVPHGGKVSRLINTDSDGTVNRYFPDGNGGGTILVNKFIKRSRYDQYSKTDCFTSCHSGSTDNGGEFW